MLEIKAARRKGSTDNAMKAFFFIILLVAVGGGYYYFVHLDNSIDDLVEDGTSLIPAGADEKPAAPVAKSTPAPAKPKPAAKPKPVKKAAPAKSEIDLFVEKKYPMPMILSLADITKNWSAVPPNAYPKQILASEPVPFTLMINGQPAGATKIQPGTPMKPVRLAGDQLTVASLVNASMQTQVHVDKTNFKQTIEKRYNDFVARKKTQIAATRAKAKQALLAKPDRLASLKNKGKGGDSNDPRLAAVKASIKRGEAHPASIDEATSYMWNGSETIGGEMRGSYDTVDVHFEVATIFGKFPTDYKCLLRAGKVVGWIDPITEEKITKD